MLDLRIGGADRGIRVAVPVKGGHDHMAVGGHADRGAGRQTGVAGEVLVILAVLEQDIESGHE